MTTATAPSAQGLAPMSRRQTLEALSGLLMGLFVAILSSTIVSNALPTIVTQLHGSQTQYTWVVTASLLAATATTPIWGKLADLMSKKLLVQVALVVFILGSMAAGLSQNMEQLIGFRVVQGLGLGGLQALAQIVIAAMIPPRERGRYNGFLGAVMAVGVVAGPLIGGIIVDTSWLGWRWCFYVGAPIAVIALGVLQRTLHLPTARREVHIDYLGATLIAAGVSVLLVWSSFAGHDFAWASVQTVWYVAGGVALLALAVVAETRAAEPVVPLRLFRNRTMVLATTASLVVGVAMYGSSVFLGQYYQIGRGYSPTKAGLMTIPLMAGVLVASTVSGALISRFGRWKAYLVSGSVLLAGGMFLLSTIDHATSIVLIGGMLAVLGLGVGMTMQNLVLSVQNSVPLADLGSSSSTVAFFRSLGGAVGVSALGTVLTTHVTDLLTQRAASSGAGSSGSGSIGLSNFADLPAALRTLVATSYGDAVARVFLIAGVLALLVIACVVLIKEVPLRTTLDLQPDPGHGTDHGQHAAPAAQALPTPLAAQRPGRHATSEDMHAFELSLLAQSDDADRRIVDGAQVDSEQRLTETREELAILERRIAELHQQEARLSASVRTTLVDGAS